jgi:hypothetical protein
VCVCVCVYLHNLIYWHTELIINVHDVMKLEFIVGVSVKIMIFRNVICSFAHGYLHCVVWWIGTVTLCSLVHRYCDTVKLNKYRKSNLSLAGYKSVFPCLFTAGNQTIA